MKVTSRSENLFYNNQEDSFSAVEDWNLTDEILSEGADVNSPAYIENITKNMELSPFSKKNSFVVSNRTTIDSILMKSYFTPDQWISEIKPSKDLIKGQKTTKKRTLKEDISSMLRTLAQKSKQWNSQPNKNYDQNFFVSMKDIWAFEEN